MEPGSIQHKKESWILFNLAWPVSVGYFLQFGLNLTSIMFVGRLGTSELAASALATMFSNVTGIGMACALDTLCGQAHTGSSDQKASGKHLQRSIIIMFFISLIVAIVWLVAEPLLILLKQDPEIARLTSLYLFYLIPAIFPYFIYECLRRFLQSQGIMNGSMFVVVSVFPINIMLQYFFIYYLDFGYIGAAIGLSVTNILEPLLLLVYMKIHPNGFEAWGGWSLKECFNVRLLWEFCKLGIPGIGMHCSEWWCFEIMAIAAGWIGNDALAAQSIILNTCGLSYMLPLGVSVAAGTRTGNILGSNEPDSARVSSRAALSLGLLFASFNFMFYLSVKDFWGKLWLDNDNVTNIISQILPLIAVFQLSDGLNCVAGGILRGCGEQRIGASVNFIGYYGLGIPLSLVLAFYYNLGLFGLWIGVSLAVVLVSFFEVLIILRLDWKAQAKKAQDRLELENSEEEPLISE